MKNSQNIKKLINHPRSINSNVVGFRVSIEEMDKLKDTQKALKNIGIKGNITNALRVRALKSIKKAGNRTVSTTQHDRSPWISEYIKRKANGVCQLCNQNAPFLNQKSVPYLETHHIIWLSKGGEDSVHNTVALCPNCHRKMHILNNKSDRDILTNVAANNN